MRLLPSLLVVTLALGCGPGEQAAEGGEESASPTLADFAGTWQSTATLEGVPDPVMTTMHGSANPAGWTMDLEGRPGVSLTVSINGDSLIAETAEYESVLRAGVMVTVRTASVLRDDVMMGTLLATYRTPNGDELVRGTMRSTRAPN